MPGNLVSATLRGGLFTRVVGKRLLFFQEIGSTMDEAAREAEAGAEEGTVVVAESQTAGRGRMGRSWVSREGNLYLSVVFRPTLQALPLLSILAGVAVTRAIRKTTGLDPRIKWPNDVLVEGKKVAGILAESVVTGKVVSHAVVGIGINVGLDTEAVKDIASFATALNAAAGRPVPREDVLRQLLHDLDALYLQVGQGGSPTAEWRALLETLGQRVRAHWRGDTYVGRAEDVDELGNLQLRLDDGRSITLSAGDVSLQGPAPSPAEEARAEQDVGQ
jgi:BirA family biotin operon repressor/biotin-[acetyl-CoA-carboxylase] ligase